MGFGRRVLANANLEVSATNQFVAGDNQVLEQDQVEIVRNSRDLRGRSNIAIAWLGITARMVVNQDKAARFQFERAIDQLPSRDLDAPDTSACNRVDREQLQMLVHIEREQPFVRFGTQ